MTSSASSPPSCLEEEGSVSVAGNVRYGGKAAGCNVSGFNLTLKGKFK